MYNIYIYIYKNYILIIGKSVNCLLHVHAWFGCDRIFFYINVECCCECHFDWMKMHQTKYGRELGCGSNFDKPHETKLNAKKRESFFIDHQFYLTFSIAKRSISEVFFSFIKISICCQCMCTVRVCVYMQLCVCACICICVYVIK